MFPAEEVVGMVSVNYTVVLNFSVCTLRVLYYVAGYSHEDFSGPKFNIDNDGRAIDFSSVQSHIHESSHSLIVEKN